MGMAQDKKNPRRTSVDLTDKALTVFRRLEPLYSGKNIFSGGVLALARLSSDDREAIIGEANEQLLPEELAAMPPAKVAAALEEAIRANLAELSREALGILLAKESRRLAQVPAPKGRQRKGQQEVG